MSDEIEVTEKRGPGRPKKETVDVSAAEPNADLVKLLLDKFQEMMGQNSEQNLALVEALKKPTELEQQNLDKERNQRIKRAEMSIRAAKQYEAKRNQAINACRAEGHQDKHGNTRFRGQIHSDGMIHPVCQKCQLEMPAIKANAGQTAVDMWQWKGVTEDTLRNLSAQTMAS